MDVGHNPEALRYFLTSFKEKPIVVYACGNNKDLYENI